MRRLFGYDAKKEKKRDAGRGHTGRVFRGGDTEATPTAKSIVGMDDTSLVFLTSMQSK